MKKANYEVFENNGGGLYLVILDEHNEPSRIFCNWEYEEEPGVLAKAIAELADDPTAYEVWGGDLMDEIANWDHYAGWTVADVYEDGLGELVADSTGLMDVNKMGFAARHAFGITDDDE